MTDGLKTYLKGNGCAPRFQGAKCLQNVNLYLPADKAYAYQDIFILIQDSRLFYRDSN
jgi:hypothetical protein